MVDDPDRALTFPETLDLVRIGADGSPHWSLIC
jgi:hypothetical protein